MRTKEEILKHGRLIRDYGVMFSGLIGELVKLVEDQDALFQEPAPEAWQQRYLDPVYGPSYWQFADDRTVEALRGRPDYELRPLYAAPQPQPAAVPDWLHSPETMAERLMRAGWRPDGDAQHSEVGELVEALRPLGERIAKVWIGHAHHDDLIWIQRELDAALAKLDGKA